MTSHCLSLHGEDSEEQLVTSLHPPYSQELAPSATIYLEFKE